MHLSLKRHGRWFLRAETVSKRKNKEKRKNEMGKRAAYTLEQLSKLQHLVELLQKAECFAAKCSSITDKSIRERWVRLGRSLSFGSDIT